MQETYFITDEATAGATLAAALRPRLAGMSWREVKALVTERRVKVGGHLETDPARRLKPGEAVVVLARPVPQPREATETGLVIRHLDDHVVVVEKPSGVSTVRHPSERDWPEARKQQSPALTDILARAIARRLNASLPTLPRLRVVHRLDKETSGLVCFARTALAERELGRQFKAHTVIRRYLALVSGILTPGRIESVLVRDRGDGRRGSSEQPNVTGKRAVTHTEIVRRLPGFTLVGCRLETGRTHQIRIHLAEHGHPVCGEKVYTRRPDGSEHPDASGAERLALHAEELGFEHPLTRKPVHWSQPLPAELARLVERLATPG